MSDPLSRQLVALHQEYKVRALAPSGDRSAHDALFDEFIRNAMAVLERAYGEECAGQVRASALRHARPPRCPRWLERLALAGNRSAQCWYVEWRAMSRDR